MLKSPPKIDQSTQEERRAYVLNSWKCMSDCEVCGKCKVLRGKDPEILYADYINGLCSYMDITLQIRNHTY